MSGVLEGWNEGHDWLQGLESPYSWRPSELLSAAERTNIVSRLTEKELKLEAGEQKVFTFDIFVLKILLGYELFVSASNYTAAMMKLNETEQKLDILDITSHDTFYREVRRANWHVTLSSQAILLARVGRLDLSKSVVEPNFDPVSSFNNIELGALYGIKGRAFLEYGVKGWREALKWIKKAIEANPREPKWHFLAGKTLEKIRKNSENFTSIPEEEIEHFEKAEALSDIPDYAMHLAKVYQNVVFRTFMKESSDQRFKGSPLYEKLGNLNRRTVQLYTKTFDKTPHRNDIQIKCFDGMLKLLRQFLNEHDIHRMFNQLNNATVKTAEFYNVAGLYYLKIRRDKKEALKFFEQGSALGNYQSAVNALRIEIKTRQGVDTEVYLRHLADRFKHDRKCYEDALSHLGLYYLFRRHDLGAAIEIFNCVMESNPKSKAMMEHKPIFVRSTRPVNIFELLADEVRMTSELPERTSIPQKTLDKFMSLLSKYHPALLTHP